MSTTDPPPETRSGAVSPDVLLTNARIVTATDTRHGWLHVRDGQISELGSVGEQPSHPPRETVDVAGQWVVPGLVDMHCHGGARHDFGAATPHTVPAALAPHQANGTTSTIASLVTAAPAELLTQVQALACAAADGHIAGIHLEGPYLAAERCGAHDPAQLRDPDRDEFERLLEAAEGHLRMITLAPERPGALDLITTAVQAGVTVALGHTEASYNRTRHAIDAGATVVTHLFNAMPSLHHRNPGPVAAALTDERVTVELINDGVHVHRATAEVAVAATGPARLALITDAMAAAGAGDGEFELGGLRVEVHGGTARLASDGAVAGSTIVLHEALLRAVRELGLDVPRAVRAASTVPARALGLTDRGDLAPGTRGDVLILDEALALAGQLTRGRWVRRPD